MLGGVQGGGVATRCLRHKSTVTALVPPSLHVEGGQNIATLSMSTEYAV